MAHQLANNAFSYWRVVQATCPIPWIFIDFLLQWKGRRAKIARFYMFVKLPLYWLLVLPSIVQVALRLAYRSRQASKSTRGHILLSMALLVLAALMFAMFFAIEHVLLPELLGDEIYSALTLLGIMGVVTPLLWCCLPMMGTATIDPPEDAGGSADVAD